MFLNCYHPGLFSFTMLCALQGTRDIHQSIPLCYPQNKPLKSVLPVVPKLLLKLRHHIKFLKGWGLEQAGCPMVQCHRDLKSYIQSCAGLGKCPGISQPPLLQKPCTQSLLFAVRAIPDSGNNSSMLLRMSQAVWVSGCLQSTVLLVLFTGVAYIHKGETITNSHPVSNLILHTMQFGKMIEVKYKMLDSCF